MRRHRARQRLVAGAVFVVLASGCSSDAAVLAGDVSADGAGVATAVLVTSVPTTEIIAGPLPSPTALSVEEPPVTPVPVTPAPVTPIPASAVPVSTAVPATPVPAASAVPATPVPATTAPIAGSQQVLAANGAEVFTLNCARCHGENGLGSQQYSAGLISVGSRYSTAAMIAELTTGHPVTFGFADRLSAEEIASVVAYVKSVFP